MHFRIGHEPSATDKLNFLLARYASRARRTLSAPEPPASPPYGPPPSHPQPKPVKR